MSHNPEVLKLRTLLGDSPGIMPLSRGEVSSPGLVFDIADVKMPVHNSFRRVVRDLEFDVSELAIITYLQAKSVGKPLVLIPAVLSGGRNQHASMVYYTERGHVTPQDLPGRRVGIRASSVTAVAWVRGILQNEYGVELDRVSWITFEDPHVAECGDPPNITRAPAGSNMKAMLLEGKLDAAVLDFADLKDPRLCPVIPDAENAFKAWLKRYNMPSLNHLLVVRQSLSKSHPWAVEELFRLIVRSKTAAGFPSADGLDPYPVGVAAISSALQMAIKYAAQQRLIPRAFEVDELFDEVTRNLKE